jgi:F420-non-reducing hydrogenase iron-sulfur subunit
MSDAQKTVITLICERACDINGIVDASGNCTEVPGMKVVKFPCSGMIQPLMIEAAIKGGADGVVVTGCQIGDCYYREGNRMIRERLLGDRPPTLKKGTDRRRILALWLAKPQRQRFISESKEFIASLNNLAAPEAK